MSITLDKILLAEDFDSADKVALRGLLSNKSMQAAMKVVYLEAQERDKLTSVDLVRQEGLNEALVVQGEVRGMITALDHLLELAVTDNEEKN